MIELNLGDLTYMPETNTQPALVFQSLAEGYNRMVTVPVNFRFNGELLFTAEGPQAECC